MTKSIIPIAGIFLACVIAAGIPAVAAAGQTQPVAAPTTESTPWYAHLGDWVGLHAQSDTHAADTTSGTTTENKDWWNNLWPFKENTVKTEQPAATPQTAVQTPVPTPAETPAQTPAQNPAVTADPAGQKSVTDKPQETRPVDPAHAG